MMMRAWRGGSWGGEGKAGVRTVEDKEPPELPRREEEDDDGDRRREIDVSRRGGRPEGGSGAGAGAVALVLRGH